MKKRLIILVAGLLFSTLLFTGCDELDSIISQDQAPASTEQVADSPIVDTEVEQSITEILPDPVLSSEPLIVSVLDVGQADCILLQQAEDTMIIDAGNNADSEFVVDYLQSEGIEDIDVVIGTHPHEDHIGGLDAVITAFDIGTIYMPKVSYTTKTYEDVVTAIKNKNLSITTPVPGSSFTLGDGVTCFILAPNSTSYEDTNSYSIVLKVTYNGKSFIFTGDAEADSEEEILAQGYDIKADVLKVGHHGSTSSTSDAFLQAVSPEYAVISVGADNTYGHPHQETMDKLNESGIEIYRTDVSGTVTFIVDETGLSVHTEK